MPVNPSKMSYTCPSQEGYLFFNLLIKVGEKFNFSLFRGSNADIGILVDYFIDISILLRKRVYGGIPTFWESLPLPIILEVHKEGWF